MLAIRDITFNMQGTPLLSGASAVIPTGHKVGLVGRNGSGKTTLFRLIRGELTLDGGEIEVPKGARIGGVAQEAPASDDSLLETVLAADTERASLLQEAETAADPARIAEIQMRLSEIKSHSAEARASTILAGLGFDKHAQSRACKEFSGGLRMRVALAAVLFSRPDVLLLDEPTNYLDLEGAVWLESYLAKYPYTTIIISHDRHLLNRAVGAILHLHDQKLTLYQGNYDVFDNVRRVKLEQQIVEKKKIEARRAHMQKYVDRFRYKATKARQAQSRLKAIAKLRPPADVVGEKVPDFNFPEVEELSPPILRLERVDVGYGSATVLRDLDLRIDQDDRIALLGANGQGKSTLSKLVSSRLQPMKGKIVAPPRLRIGYFAQHQMDELDSEASPLEHMRRLLPGELPGKLRSRLANGGLEVATHETPIGQLSGGQKARLTLITATLNAPHLLILDEPTNHLDIESREALVEALMRYNGAVILVSHDAFLVELIADRLWLVKDGKVSEFSDDLDAYRKLLLSGPGEASSERKAQKKQKNSGDLSAIRSDIRKYETLLDKLGTMREKLDSKLADPELYAQGAPEISKWQSKHAEVLDAISKAESMWIAAQEKLEEAG